MVLELHEDLQKEPIIQPNNVTENFAEALFKSRVGYHLVTELLPGPIKDEGGEPQIIGYSHWDLYQEVGGDETDTLCGNRAFRCVTR